MYRPITWRHQFQKLMLVPSSWCTIIQALTCCSDWSQATLPQIGILYSCLPCSIVAFRLLECILEAIWVSFCIHGDSHRSCHLLVHQYMAAVFHFCSHNLFLILNGDNVICNGSIYGMKNLLITSCTMGETGGGDVRTRCPISWNQTYAEIRNHIRIIRLT